MARYPDPDLRLWWRRLVKQQPLSDLTVTDFCEAHDVSTASFYLWRRKIAQEQDDAPAFVPLHLAPAQGQHETIRFRFDCGVVLELPTEDTLALTAVIRELISSNERQSS